MSSARASVAAIAAIEHDTVAEVNNLCLNSVLPVVVAVELVGGIAVPVVAGTVETWRTVGHMGNEVMVE